MASTSSAASVRAAMPAHCTKSLAEMKRFCIIFCTGRMNSGGAMRYPRRQPVMA